MIHRITKKIKEVGLINFIKGLGRNIYYKKLQREYDFDSWHESPYEWRKYAQIVVRYVNEKKAETVVDMGCGLGEVIRNIKAKNKIGYDPASEVVLAAKRIDKKSLVKYEVGSFDDIMPMKKVDYFITLGFMHGCREDIWKPAYHKVSTVCEINNFIVDVLPENGEWNQLDFTKILPENYRIKERIGPLLGGRYIEIYEKQV